MSKVTYAQRTADCGHTYMGYTTDKLWVRCNECTTRMRLNMQLENAYRRYVLASTRTSTQWYKISPTVRAAVYERDGWVCQLCLDPVDPHLPFTDIWSATLDHIICRSWVTTPDHSESNLRLAHRWCNSVRGNESTYDATALLPAA